jgi:serine/threonine-protein kinase
MSPPAESSESTVGLARLLRWGSVPASSEEARAFLQRRVAISIGVLALLWAIGAALAIPLAFATDPEGAFGGMNTVRNAVHVGGALLLAALWLAVRRGRWSARRLAAVDVSATLLQALVLATMVLTSLAIVQFRPELSMTFGVTYVLLTRAVIVPSTARATLLIGAAACVPILAATHSLYDRALAAGLVPHVVVVGSPWVFVGWVSVFGVLSVVASAMVSAVIYGLSRAVLRARQLGQYTLEETIGEGGMGTVYRARHALLRRPTAIKLLPADRAGADTVARFEREVQITSQLTHPNTVAIYDYGRTPDGVFYYAMEYLDGFDLEVLVASDGAQPPGRVRHFLRQIAGALAEAHARGLIHRDVKPSNVVVCERGLIPDFVKVLDFGLARDFTAPGVGVTQAGQLAGTPLYMSPEQIRSAPLDGRSDLYALGAVGYHLLAGRPPWSAANAVEMWAHHLHSPVPALPPSVPASLARLVHACLEKEPERRPASAAALLAALDGCDDVAAWTDEDARRWWRERAAAVRAAGEPHGAVSPDAPTVEAGLR